MALIMSRTIAGRCDNGLCCSAQRQARVRAIVHLHGQQHPHHLFAFSRHHVIAGVVAQEPFRYREFQLGSDLASVAKLTGSASSGAKVIHARPAMMQDLEWRPRYYAGGASPVTDPVDMMLFRFYDDQLFMVVVDYDRRRTEGMSPADMIAAVSATYGPVSQVPSRRLGTPTVQYGFPDTPLAVWGNADYSVTLLRVTYPASFRLVVALDAARGPCRNGKRRSGAAG